LAWFHIYSYTIEAQNLLGRDGTIRNDLRGWLGVKGPVPHHLILIISIIFFTQTTYIQRCRNLNTLHLDKENRVKLYHTGDINALESIPKQGLEGLQCWLAEREGLEAVGAECIHRLATG